MRGYDEIAVEILCCPNVAKIRQRSSNEKKQQHFFQGLPLSADHRRIFLLIRIAISPINEIVSTDECRVNNEHAGKNPVSTGTP
ncbi:MAG: hypothetical protein WAK61_10535 [Leclercia sp.]